MADEYLSKHFTLNDLTHTDAPLMVPNTFDKPEYYTNLKNFAKNVLDKLYEKIGPFDVISGYRSTAVQAWVGTQTEQAALPGKSFHDFGMAADIMPTTMSAEAYYARILIDDTIRPLLGEIALKNTVIHLSTAVPPTKVGMAMLVENDVYRKISSAEEQSIITRMGLAKTVALGAGTIAILGLGVVAVLYMISKRKKQIT